MSKPNERIPFEPNNRSKKAKAKEPKKAPVAPVTANINNSKPKISSTPTPKRNDPLGIPEEVNRRIIRRAALFCGVPTGLGITTFVVSYIVVSRHLIDLPTYAVVLVSMLFLGLGVVGLSYGAISASWDEGRVGSWWGNEEFKKNFGYLREAWKSQKQLVKTNQQSKK